MRYSIERDDDGRWLITGFNSSGQVGSKVLCSDTDQLIKIFCMLEGYTIHEDGRHEDLLNQDTQKVSAA